jgi:tRNA G18 (ribose-2'-O)-methylase SpoU
VPPPDRQTAPRQAAPRPTAPRPTLRVTSRNARFQQWESLLANRTKRHRLGEFLVHGVRPITLAVRRDWPLAALLHRDDRALSAWARETIAATDAEQVAVAAHLLRELADRDGGGHEQRAGGGREHHGATAASGDDVPELVAVARTRPDDLDRIDVSGDGVVVVFDRPTSPGNLGTLIRSADAFGARGVVVCGHAADVYDPRTVRASTGSLFAVPTVQVAAARDVLGWLDGRAVAIVGTDEAAPATVTDADLTGPTVLVVGNETAGLSSAWREACTALVRIPIGGDASSLNAASAGTVVLYEAARQRGFPATGA